MNLLSKQPGSTDPMTAADGVRLMTELQEQTKTIQSFANRIAIIQSQHIQILELLASIDSSFSETRIGRMEQELKEIEMERDMAQQRLKVWDEKLTIRQTNNVATVDTNEKIKRMTNEALASAEKAKKDDEEAWRRDLRRTAIKALVTLGIGTAFTAVLGFVVFLIRLYLASQGSP